MSHTVIASPPPADALADDAAILWSWMSCLRRIHSERSTSSLTEEAGACSHREDGGGYKIRNPKHEILNKSKIEILQIQNSFGI